MNVKKTGLQRSTTTTTTTTTTTSTSSRRRRGRKRGGNTTTTSSSSNKDNGAGAGASEEENSMGNNNDEKSVNSKLIAALSIFMQWYAKDVFDGNVRDLNKWNCISKEISSKVFRLMLKLPWFESYYPVYTFEELYKTVPRQWKSLQGYLLFKFGLINKDLRYLSQQSALDLSRQRGVSGNGFAHLSSIQKLNVAMCIQLTDDDFDMIPTQHLTTLNIRACGNPDLTDNAFKRWDHVQRLNMRWCDQVTITDEAFQHLQSVRHLDISGCQQFSLTDAAFAHLSNLVSLNMSDCVQFTDNAFAHFGNLTHLNMNDCSQTSISDKAFEHLGNLVTLKMQGCNQSTITDAAFTHLSDFCSVVSGPVVDDDDMHLET